MANSFDYYINLKANTAGAETAISKLQNQLSQISATPININDNSLVSASQAAAKLQTSLTQAMNVNTGKLDLALFSKQLKNSQTSIVGYQKQLSALGPTGQQAFLSLSKAIATAEAPMANINPKLVEFGKTLKRTINWQLSSSIVHGTMSEISRAVSYMEKLNSSLNNIRIVTGQTTAEMAQFAKQANTAAKILGTSTTTYTDAALIYYQQGLKGKDVTDRTETTVKMANVTGQTATQVSNQMTSIWNNFDDGSKSLESYADTITALGAATASSSSEIAEGLGKFASIADTVGLSYNYATTALATVVAQTRQGADTVGTAFKTIFARLQDLELGNTLDDDTSLGQYSEALYKVGINIKTTSGDMKDMDTILDEMGSKWKTLSKDQQTALAQTVAGTRQYTQLVALMDNWSTFQKNLTVAENSEGTLAKQQAIYEQSWAGAQKKVKASVEGVYNSLIDEKPFITLTNGLSGALTVVQGLVEGLGGLKGILLAISGVVLNSYAKQIPAVMSNFLGNAKTGLVNIGKRFLFNSNPGNDQVTAVQQDNARALMIAQAQATTAKDKVALQGSSIVNAMNQQFLQKQRYMSDQDKIEYQNQMKLTEQYYDNLSEEYDKNENQREQVRQSYAPNQAVRDFRRIANGERRDREHGLSPEASAEAQSAFQQTLTEELEGVIQEQSEQNNTATAGLTRANNRYDAAENAYREYEAQLRTKGDESTWTDEERARLVTLRRERSSARGLRTRAEHRVASRQSDYAQAIQDALEDQDQRTAEFNESLVDREQLYEDSFLPERARSQILGDLNESTRQQQVSRLAELQKQSNEYNRQIKDLTKNGKRDKNGKFYSKNQQEQYDSLMQLQARNSAEQEQLRNIAATGGVPFNPTSVENIMSRLRNGDVLLSDDASTLGRLKRGVYNYVQSESERIGVAHSVRNNGMASFAALDEQRDYSKYSDEWAEKEASKYLKVSNKMASVLKDNGFDEESIKTLTDRFSTGINNVFKNKSNYNDIGKNGEAGAGKALPVEEVQRRLNESLRSYITNFLDGITSAESGTEDQTETANLAGAIRTRVRTMIDNAIIGMGADPSELVELGLESEDVGLGRGRLDMSRPGAGETPPSPENSPRSFGEKFGEGLVEAGSVATSLASVFSSVSQAVQTFGDDTATVGQKMGALAGGVSSMIFASGQITDSLTKMGENFGMSGLSAVAPYLGIAATIGTSIVSYIQQQQEQAQQDIVDAASARIETYQSKDTSASENQDTLNTIEGLSQSIEKVGKASSEAADSIAQLRETALELADTYNSGELKTAVASGNEETITKAAITARKEELQELLSTSGVRSVDYSTVLKDSFTNARGSFLTDSATGRESKYNANWNVGTQNYQQMGQMANLANNYSGIHISKGILSSTLSLNSEGTSGEDLINLYEQVQSYLQLLTDQLGDEAQNSNVYKKLQNWSVNVSEAVENYQANSDAIAAYNIELQALNAGIYDINTLEDENGEISEQSFANLTNFINLRDKLIQSFDEEKIKSGEAEKAVDAYLDTVTNVSDYQIAAKGLSGLAQTATNRSSGAEYEKSRKQYQQLYENFMKQGLDEGYSSSILSSAFFDLMAQVRYKDISVDEDSVQEVLDAAKASLDGLTIEADINVIANLKDNIDDENLSWNTVKSSLGELSEDTLNQLADQYIYNNSQRVEPNYGKGNIDLNNRPVVDNGDGTYSTVDSTSFEQDGKEVLVPTVIQENGKWMHVDEETAWQHYLDTGEYLGKFDTQEESDAYAEQLHEDQDKQYTRLSGNELISELTALILAASSDTNSGILSSISEGLTADSNNNISEQIEANRQRLEEAQNAQSDALVAYEFAKNTSENGTRLFSEDVKEQKNFGDFNSHLMARVQSYDENGQAILDGNENPTYEFWDAEQALEGVHEYLQNNALADEIDEKLSSAPDSVTTDEKTWRENWENRAEAYRQQFEEYGIDPEATNIQELAELEYDYQQAVLSTNEALDEQNTLQEKQQEYEENGWREELQQQANDLDIDYNDVKTLAEQIRSTGEAYADSYTVAGDATIYATKAQQDWIRESEEFALGSLKIQKGISNLSTTMSSYKTTLNSVKYDSINKNSTQAVKALTEVRKALKDILGGETSDFSDDFILDNLEDIEKAADNDEDALKTLQKAYAKQTASEMEFIEGQSTLQGNGEGGVHASSVTGFSTEQLQADLMAAEDLFASTELPDLEANAEINTTDFYQSLTDMVRSGEMTADQMSDALSSFGMDVEEEEVTIPHETYDSMIQAGAVEHVLPDGTTELVDVSGNVYTSGSGENTYTVIKGAKYKGNGGGSKSGGGGGGGGSNKTKKKASTADRYHTVSRREEDTSAKITAKSNQIDREYGASKIESLKEQIALQKELTSLTQSHLAEATGYLAEDKKAVLDYFSSSGLGNEFKAQFDENGFITNGTEILLEIAKKSAELEAAGEDTTNLDNYKQALTDYESTLDTIEEQTSNYIESIYTEIDDALEALTTAVEIKINVDDNQLDLLEYELGKTEDKAWEAADSIATMNKQISTYEDEASIYQKEIQDILAAHGLTVDDIGTEKMLSTSFSDKEMQQLEEAQDKLKSINESLLDLDRTAQQEQISDVIDYISDALDRQYDKFDHYQSIIENIRNISDVTGVGLTKDGRDIIKQLNQTQIQNDRNRLQSAKLIQQQAENNLATLKAEQQVALDAIDASNLSDEEKAAKRKEVIESYKENIQELEDQASEAEENFWDEWNNLQQDAEQMFEDMVTDVISTYEEALSGLVGTLDQFSKVYEQAKETDEDYVDDYERLYQLSKLERELQNSIDDTDNLASKKALKKLLKEINDLQESGVELSEYDLNVLEKKYELEVARLALEEAKDAKSMVRLARDTEGNWGYIYTADEDKVSEAEQEYEDKLHDYQQLNDEYIQELEDKINEIQSAYKDELESILTDTGLTSEEKAAAIEQLTQHTEEQLAYLQSQLNNALTNQGSTYEEMLKAYGQTSADLTDTFGETNIGIATKLAGLNEDLQSMEGYFKGIYDAVEQAASEANDAIDEYEQTKKDNDEAAGASDELSAFAKALNDIATSSTAIKTALKGLASDTTDVFKSAADALDEFEKNYAEKLESMVTETEKYMNVVYQMLAIFASANGDSTLSDLLGQITDLNNALAGGKISKTEYDSKLADVYSQIRTIVDGITSSYAASASAYDTGGYTGEWDSSGRLAFLHQKEMVLNADDTKNILDVVNIVRQIELYSNSLSQGLGDFWNKLTSVGEAKTIIQNNTFNVTLEDMDRNEIVAAFDNMKNEAIQYANRA